MQSNLDLLNQINIVMVETSLAANIGSAARAMKTMGLRNLILVNPREALNRDAYARSSGAVDILESVKVVDTLEQAIEDSVFVLGASARNRHFPWPLVNPREAGEEVLARAPTGKISILFGRESSGLTNEELSLCHRHVHIPANPEYSSLNVAAAVQVLCYECRMTALGTEANNNWSEQREAEPANQEQTNGMFQHLEQALVDIEYLDPNNPKMLMPRLRRLLLRADLDQTEVNILRGILKQMQKTTQ